MGENGVQPALAAMGVVRDLIDDICGSMEMLLEKFEERRRQLELYSEAQPLSRPDTLKIMVSNLTPERVTALMSAIDDIARIVVNVEPGVNVEEEVQRAKETLTRFKQIQNNLHVALDGVVP